MVMRHSVFWGVPQPTPASMLGDERGFGGGADGRAGWGAGRSAVVDDLLGGEDMLTGPQQRGAGLAVVLSDTPPRSVGSSDIGHTRGPGAGQGSLPRGCARQPGGRR